MIAGIGPLLAAGAGAAPAGLLPPGLARQLPRAYTVLAHAKVDGGRPDRIFEIVALGRRDEGAVPARGAPARPLLIFRHEGDRFVLAGRNNHVVMRADEGGQCDPFLDGDATIATRGRYFTVQNGVACGRHWAAYVTFRLDAAWGGFVFDNERVTSWSIDRENASDADAIVRDGPPRIVRDRPRHVTPFALWRPAK